MKLISPKVIKEECAMGQAISHNTRQWLAPSIRAASMSPFGICLKFCRRRKIPKRDIVEEIMMPLKVERRFI